MDSIDIYISNKKCQVKEIIQRTEQKCTDGKDGGETSMGPEIQIQIKSFPQRDRYK